MPPPKSVLRQAWKGTKAKHGQRGWKAARKALKREMRVFAERPAITACPKCAPEEWSVACVLEYDAGSGAACGSECRTPFAELKTLFGAHPPTE